MLTRKGYDPTFLGQRGGKEDDRMIKYALTPYPAQQTMRYQMYIMDRPALDDKTDPDTVSFATGRSGQSFRRNGVEYDGFDGTTLKDAKWRYSQFLKDGKWREWFENSERGTSDLLNRARRQVEAARGLPIEWHCREPEVANAMRKLLQDAGFSPPIRVVYTPAAF